MTVVLLCVAAAGCSSDSALRVDPTIATVETTAGVPTTVAAVSTIVPTTSAPAPTTTVAAGPSDEEIQTIVSDLDAKEGAIFAAFKTTLKITPDIERMITDTFGANGGSMQEVLKSYLVDSGATINDRSVGPRTTVVKVRSRSPQCFVADVERDAQELLGRPPVQVTQLYRFENPHWLILGEIPEDDARAFDGKACALV